METRAQRMPTPVLLITRLSFILFVALESVAGISLYVLSTRTDEFFSWTIRAPLTAAFMGAGYWAALPIFIVALRIREWQRVRILIVAILVFSIFVALVTVQNLSAFHLNNGSLFAQLTAWVWVIVYILLPIIMLASLIMQERAGGAKEYEVTHPLLAWVRAALLVQALLLTAVGLGLVFTPGLFAGIWPWSLPPLPAGAVGAWVVSFAAGSWWALREGDWQRVRISLPFYILFYLLLLIAAVRFWNEFVGGPERRLLYILGLVLAVAATSFAAWQQEKGHRTVVAPDPAVP